MTFQQKTELKKYCQPKLSDVFARNYIINVINVQGE